MSSPGTQGTGAGALAKATQRENIFLKDEMKINIRRKKTQEDIKIDGNFTPIKKKINSLNQI